MLKNSRIILTLAVVALVFCITADGFALQTNIRKSQGNNFGLQLKLGNSVFTGISEYPRGSGNEIPSYEGSWGHFVGVARDLDGDGYAEDTLYGRSRGRTVLGWRGSLEAMDVLLDGYNAGNRMEQWAGRVENNEVWSSLDPDNLARWPAEFREGRTMDGAPILHGAETIGAMHSDVWNISYHGSVPPTGVSLEYQLYFLDFGESNDLAFGHLFIRNMSEYLKYNDNSSFVEQVSSTPNGQVWDSFALVYMENYLGIGHEAANGIDDGWAYHPRRVIKCIVDRDGLENGFTNGGLAFMLGYTPLRNMEFKGDTTYLSNTTYFRWSADFGIATAKDMGTLSDPGQFFRWATCLEPDGSEKDISDFYGDELSPYTGRPLTGNPGVVLPSDARYDQWLWGRQSFINYHAWSGLHQFGPRDTTSTDFAIMAAYPANPPIVLKPNDIANIDDPDIQVQLVPFEKMQDVAITVYQGGYILPETPVPPPLTIVPGDRQVTITWSNVNINTPDNYYYFIQDHPEIDPNGVYREYDFEGFRLYRNYVGPSDAHGELIWESSLGAGDLAFHYIDHRQDDDPYYRMNNGMKVWYALVPYDRNYDPASGEELSLPALEQSKVWNRTSPADYWTVRPRSDASNFVPASFGGATFNAGHNATLAEGESVDLAGDGAGNITEAPKALEPVVSFELEEITAEKIKQEVTVRLVCSGMDGANWGGCNYPTGLRQLDLLDTGGSTITSGVSLPGIHARGGANQVETMIYGPLDSDGAGYAINAEFSYVSQGDWRNNLYYKWDAGSYSGAVVDGAKYRCGARIGSAPNMLGWTKSAQFTVNWVDAGGGDLTLEVMDNTHGEAVPFGEQPDDFGWGFVYHDVIGDRWGSGENIYNQMVNNIPKSARVNKMFNKISADNTTGFAVYLNGIFWLFTTGSNKPTETIEAMPSAGETHTITTCWGSWNSDQTVWTQTPDVPYPGDSWTIQIKPMTQNAEDADLSKIRVVPNPYIASSLLDQSGSERRIEFINLPARCTVRIYSLGGNLVNALNHIGSSRTGWGTYTDYDAIQSDNTPLEFTGYDNHSGTEPWNMKNRFGQTVASGLYFYHVTDERGETHTGKFYIVN